MKILLLVFLLTLAVNAASTCKYVTDIGNLLIDSIDALGTTFPLNFQATKSIMNLAIQKSESLNNAEVTLLNISNCPGAFSALDEAVKKLEKVSAVVEVNRKFAKNNKIDSQDDWKDREESEDKRDLQKEEKRIFMTKKTKDKLQFPGRKDGKNGNEASISSNPSVQTPPVKKPPSTVNVVHLAVPSIVQQPPPAHEINTRPTFVQTKTRKTLVVYFVYFNDQDLIKLPLASNEEIAKKMKAVYGKSQEEESVNDIYNRISFGQFKFTGLNSEDVDYVGWTKVDIPKNEAQYLGKFEIQHIGEHDLIQVLLFNLVCSTEPLQRVWRSRRNWWKK